jgi:ABC-type transport system involved in cytochrome bd biosynthesis fused ATPase/permease subunit
MTAIAVEQALTGAGHTLLARLLAVGALLPVSVLLSYLDTYVSHDVSFRIVKLLQDRVYGHMDRIAPGGLAERNAADSATVILSDIGVFEWFVAHCLVEWIGTFAALIVCLALLSRISAAAAAAVFGFLVLMMGIPFFSTEQAKQKGLVMKRLYGELNGVVADGVSGHKDIIAFHWTKPFYARLDKVSDSYAQAQGQFASRGEWEKTWEALAACVAALAGLLLASASMAGGEGARLIPVFALCVSAVGCVQGSLARHQLPICFWGCSKDYFHI